MTTIPPTLIEKLKKLPPERLVEVEDFVEFLAAREERAAAAQRLTEALAKFHALNLPALTDEEIEAEVKAYRQERRRAADAKKSG